MVAQAGAKKQMSMSLTLTQNLSFVLAGDRVRFQGELARAKHAIRQSLQESKRPSEFCSACLPAAVALKCFLALRGFGKNK